MNIIDYLGNLSLAAGHLIEGSNWNCRATVVLSFATISEYINARHDLMRQMVPVRDGAVRQMADGYGEEFDFCGITFQLRCLERLITPHGPYSSVELLRRGQILYSRGP